MLKSLLAILTWLISILPRRATITGKDYDAKAAEAKELAKPDRAFNDVVDGL